MSLTPETRKENFLARIAGDPGAEKLTPITREEHFLEDIVKAVETGVTPGSVVDATAAMTPEQAAQTRQNIGADTPETVAEWLSEHVDPDTGYVLDNSLTVEGAAADAKATGDAVGELKSAIKDITGNQQIVMTNNKYYNLSGTTVDINNPSTPGSTPTRCAAVPCSEGEKFTISASGGYSSRAYGFVDSNGTILYAAPEQYQTENEVVVAPVNSAYLIVNDVSFTKTSYIGECIAIEVKRDSQQIEDIFENITNETLKTYNTIPSFTDGYYINPSNGSAVSSQNYSYTQPIEVKPGDIVSAEKSDGVIDPYMRFVCAYNDGTVAPGKGQNTEKKTYTVPDGVNQVVITVTTANGVDKIQIKRNEKVFLANCKYPPMGYLKVSGNLSNGESMSLPYENLKNNVVLNFTGRITSFSMITIGKKENRRYLAVNGTNIVVNDGNQTYTQAHGLTIANDISITIEFGETTKLKKIVLESSGDEYTYTNNSVYTEDEHGNWSCVSDGSALTDCVLSVTSRNINNKLWMFGDSYFSLNTDRWVYYLLNNGFTSPMIDAYSGESAQNAIIALQNLLSCRTPENVLWCLGMNNGDTSSAVNVNWKKAYDSLMNLSKEYGFNVILATIPNTPTVSNDYKNAIVKSSGKQYIDFAASVNVGADGAWINGALSNDNVHPTTKGAKILYHRAITDCPQLTSIT